MPLVPFVDLERLPDVRFTWENSVIRNGDPMVMYEDVANGVMRVLRGWQLLGWTANPPRHSWQTDEIGVLAFHPQYGELWCHLPPRRSRIFDVSTSQAKE